MNGKLSPYLFNGDFRYLVSKQDYTPWGEQRGSDTTTGQTSLNYTGQRKDATGLLYYHSRYYDPALGRFLSPDTVVPGNASGGMDGVQLRPLTVDVHEPGFVAQLSQENQQPFWFQMSAQDQQKAGSPFGPMDPQGLNRYSYVRNNPIKYSDPTGHLGLTVGTIGNTYHLTHDEAVWLWKFMTTEMISVLTEVALGAKAVGEVLKGLHNQLMRMGMLGALVESIILAGTAGEAFATVAAFVAAVTTIATTVGLLLSLADAAYGYKGVDILILSSIPAPIILPPTVERQHGIWDITGKRVTNLPSCDSCWNFSSEHNLFTRLTG